MLLLLSFHLVTSGSCQPDRVTCVTEVRNSITVSLCMHTYVLLLYMIFEEIQ